jgi:hypothetical protein
MQDPALCTLVHRWGSRWIASLASGELTVPYTETGGVAVIAPNLAPVYRSSTFAAICA